jgi:hypothetical protein
MRFSIVDNDISIITFNNNAKVSLLSERAYTVKWFCDDEYIGEMILNPGTWGAYPLNFGNWKIEYWLDNELINTYDNNLKGKDVLFITEFDNVWGKLPDVTKLEKRIDELKNKYNTNIVAYFKNSERFRFTHPTLKMNNKYNFVMSYFEKI